MGFNIMPSFKLYENDEELFQGNSIFEEFLDSTTIFEDTLDLGITRDDAKFFKQFNFYATMVRSSNARHLLSPIKEHKDEWRDVMQKGQLYNPFETFIIMQFTFYLSKRNPKSEITFVVGYQDVYIAFINLMDGEMEFAHHTIFDYDTYATYMETDNLTISSEELAYIFKKLNEKTN
jgi:hypothetical protein